MAAHSTGSRRSSRGPAAPRASLARGHGALARRAPPPRPHLTRVQPRELLAGVYYGSQYGGSTTSILVNVPGEATSVVGLWVSLLRVPQAGLLAAIVVFTLIGTFSVNNSVFDLFVLVAMGALGYLLRKLDFDVAPVILALILGPMLEQALVQSLALGRGDPLIFFMRPISGTLLAATIAVVAGPALWTVLRRPPRAGRGLIPPST